MDNNYLWLFFFVFLVLSFTLCAWLLMARRVMRLIDDHSVARSTLMNFSGAVARDSKNFLAVDTSHERRLGKIERELAQHGGELDVLEAVFAATASTALVMQTMGGEMRQQYNLRPRARQQQQQNAGAAA